MPTSVPCNGSLAHFAAMSAAVVAVPPVSAVVASVPLLAVAAVVEAVAAAAAAVVLSPLELLLSRPHAAAAATNTMTYYYGVLGACRTPRVEACGTPRWRTSNDNLGRFLARREVGARTAPTTRAGCVIDPRLTRRRRNRRTRRLRRIDEAEPVLSRDDPPIARRRHRTTSNAAPDGRSSRKARARARSASRSAASSTSARPPTAWAWPWSDDEQRELWALGPESLGGRALVTAEAPDLVAARRGRQRVPPLVAAGPEGRARRLGARIEAAASTCPGGRRCVTELHPARRRDRHGRRSS